MPFELKGGLGLSPRPPPKFAHVQGRIEGKAFEQLPPPLALEGGAFAFQKKRSQGGAIAFPWKFPPKKIVPSIK